MMWYDYVGTALVVIGVFSFIVWFAADQIRDLRSELQRRKNIMTITHYRLPIACPICRSEKSMRLKVESDGYRVICIDCEEVDEEMGDEEILAALTSLVQYSHDNNGVTHEELADIVCEKLDLPESDDGEDDEGAGGAA